MNNKNKKLLASFMIIIFLGSTISIISVNGEPENKIEYSVYLNSFEIIETELGHKIMAEDFGRLLVQGKPNLPSKIFSIAIPPNAEITKVEFDISNGIFLSGNYSILPCPPAETIDKYDSIKDTTIFDINYGEVYNSNDPYPSENAIVARNSNYRKYSLVDIQVTPFTYYPISNELMYYPEIKIFIHYAVDESLLVFDDNLKRTETFAEKIISNYNQIQGYYKPSKQMSRGVHDYVIITLDSLTSFITPLVNWETSKGRNVHVVTTSWIDGNYGGYDLQEKMRNFLREKYPSDQWGIEDVLFIGHYDDVPMRMCSQDIGYGQPETDFYYAELSLPDNQSWDSDEDHLYGESSDTIDFYAEINVGRIPWSDPSIVSDICNKSVVYEQNNDPSFKKNILLLGAFFWADTDNAELMEEIANNSWMSDWTKTRMYEQGDSTFAMDYNLDYDNVETVWSEGTYGFVNWAGHGSYHACYEAYPSSEPFVNIFTCDTLNDDYPAIVFADACSNQDTSFFNLGQAMMKQGAIGFLGSTKVAYGNHGWNDPYDGSSQSFDYFFTSSVTSGNYTVGQAHQLALVEMYTNGLWYFDKYETFEWGAYLGNPNLRMNDPFSQVDVNQNVFDRGFPIRHADDGDWAGAQSFTPTLNKIIGVDVYLRKFGTPEFDLNVELRMDDPQGTLIDTIVFTPVEVDTSFNWLFVDFINTTVISGTEYFIVIPPAPSGVTTSFGYEWGYAFGNHYNDGAFWFTRDGGVLWRDLPSMYEFTFRSYGVN